MKRTTNLLAKAAGAAVLATIFAACGGGGGGGDYAGTPVYYPYQTVYGDVCTTQQATPGCTFNRDGSRVKVSQDPDYNKYGFGSDDMKYVKFYADGTADVYDMFGTKIQAFKPTSTFPGWQYGNVIGVGTTGLFFENVVNGTYWLGKNNVLYNANPLESNYGKAINTEGADQATDGNFAALATEGNAALVKAGAQKLQDKYGMKADRAEAVASALNSFAVSAVERGYATENDVASTFTATFGVEFSEVSAAVRDLRQGNSGAMKQVVNRMASANGLSERDAQRWAKDVAEKAVADFGYGADLVGNLGW